MSPGCSNRCALHALAPRTALPKHASVHAYPSRTGRILFCREYSCNTRYRVAVLISCLLLFRKPILAACLALSRVVPLPRLRAASERYLFSSTFVAFLAGGTRFCRKANDEDVFQTSSEVQAYLHAISHLGPIFRATQTTSPRPHQVDSGDTWARHTALPWSTGYLPPMQLCNASTDHCRMGVSSAPLNGSLTRSGI
ncbi:hypothetical protein BKA93DRAFT_773541 [Sparassis latifolia]